MFSNVGALRKHIRVSHPEIYKAKQLDKISQYGALRKPDRKSCDTRDENCDSQESDKVEKIGKGLRRKSSRDKLTETEGVSSENKENSEIEQEKYHFEHGISFTADEIDDGGSRFKFSCTVCKKRFSNYVNMCRHRRKAHGNETRPRPEVPKPLPVTRLNPKKPKPLYSESPEEVALFYAGVSHNIATNLNEYIDGKVDSLENFKDHIKIEDYTPVSNETVKDVNPIDLTWEMYNFPPNYKPGKTISFTEIRQEFDIHSDFDSHCKSFDNQSDTVNLVEEESEPGSARVRIQGSKILKTGDLDETTTCSNLSSRHSEVDLKQRTSENTEENKDKVNAPEKIKKTDNTCDFRLSASSENSDNSKMDLSDGKVLSILRRKLHKSREECASPFKHIENGEYANFDDLLIGDIDSPIIPRSQSVSSGISFKRKDLLKTSYINKSENMLDSLGNGNDEKSEEKSDVGPAFSPQTLSFLCENLLGLKRKETVNVGQNSSSGSSSLSSLDSHSSINEPGHNGSLFTTLSLAANQKEDERFQSTNQIFRDIKADYSEAPNHSLENYHDIAFGKNGQVASVCAICKKHFRDFDGLLRHHKKKHPASICQFIEVEQGNEIDALHFSEPSTVGALAVTDPGLDSVSDREVFTCTGCGSVFKTLAKLHIHIVSCTPIYSATRDIKSEKGSKTPIKKKIQNKVKNILNGGNSFKYKIQDLDTEKDENVQEGIKTQNGVETKTKSKVFSGFTGFRTILPKPPMTQLPIHMLDSTVKPRRKKGQELRGYNPQNHVRRRELTELVDCHQCEACGLKFKTIILLERHVPNCSRKEKFKELCPMKCPIMDQSLEKLKHVCHYCHKHFTYLKSLVNHLHDFCAAKKQKVDSNTITDEDRVKENEIITKFKKLEEEKVGTVKVVENGARKKGWQKGVKRRPKRKGHSWTSIKRKKSGNGDINGEDIDTNAVDNGLVDKSSSSDEYEETDADYDLEKGTIPLKDEASTVNDNSDNIENEFSAFNFNEKAAIITIAPLEDPDVVKNDSNSLHAPHSSEIADDIDEVDSGNDVFSNHKDSLSHIQREDNNEKVIVINALSAPVITGQAKIIQHSENIIKMETNTSRVGHMSEEGELMVNNVFSDLSNTEEVKANETGNMMKHSITQDENSSCDYKTANVLRPVHLDQEESDPLELEATLPTRERTKSFLFQCMGSQVKTSEETTSSTSDSHEVKERRFDSGWKKFRKSMKKKLGRSKGKYEVNKDTKDVTSLKVKENRLLKSFRKTQPKSLEKLFQENSTSNSHSGCEPAKEKSQLEGIAALMVAKENPLIENGIVQSDDEQDPTQSLVGKVEEKERLILETCGKEAQSNSQTAKKEDNNVSVDLTDEIQIFEIAASGNICFNVHNVRMEKPSLPIGKTFGSDKKASSPVLTNAEPCQTFSAESPNLTTDITSNEQELCKDNYSPAQETDLLGGDVPLKGENTLCNAEIGHGDHQIKKVSNETTVDSCSKSNKNAITNEYEESDISSKNMNEIKAETIDTGTNNDEKIVAASYLTNVELLSPNDLLSRPNDLLSSHNDDEEVLDEEEKYVNNIVKDSVKPNMAKEIENSQCTTNIPSVVKENTVEDKNTDHFVCESTNQRTDDKEVTLLAAERENCVALNENNVKNNEIENGEVQALVYETSTDAIPAALENEPVFESVSEKVKKRKRNASGRQFNEFVHENKNIGNVVNATVVKKTVSKNKKTENDNSRIIDATKKSNMASAVPNSVKTTRPDRLLSKITTKKYSANNKPIKDNVKPKASEPAQETTKIGRFSKVKKTKSTSPKFKKKKPTSPVKSDRPFEVVLSPGERVKMNKRQCRKEFYNVGLTYMNKIERMSREGFTKNAETITSEADDKMVKDTSQESHPLSNVNETIEATNNSTKMNIREKTELQSSHVTDNSSEKADAISDVKRIQKSKSKSKLPRKISKESLAIGAKLAGSSLNLSVSMNETDMKRKRGRPKMNESSKESQCIPSKIPKFGSKDTDNLSLAEAVSAKRQHKAKLQKGT